MLKNAHLILRVICLGLAALVLYQVSRLAARPNPLKGVRLPVPAAAISSNAPAPSTAGQGTNVARTSPPSGKGTNSAPLTPPAAKNSSPMPRPGPGGNMADIPPLLQTNINRIVQSEILGPVPHPPPMALLGIAGKDAFLRSPEGQTGLLKEGETLGSIKLLQIGTNRVLVEQEGQKKELTIFEGYGSETLLPKGKENPQ